MDYNPPLEVPPPPIFNPRDYLYEVPGGLTQGVADLRYLKKSGDTATGSILFASGLLVNDGGNVSPSQSFILDSNTGVYRIASDQLGLACGGIKQLDLSTTLALFTNPIQVPSGSVGTTAVQVGATNVGLYSSAVNTLNVSTNGVNRLGISTTQILPQVVIKTIDGTSADVAYGFVNQPAGTGFTCNAVNRLAMCVSSTAYTQWTGGFVDNVVQLRSQQGTAGAPSIVGRIAGQESTGLYWTATPSLNISTGGVQRCNITSTALQLNGVPLDCNGQNVRNAPQVGNEAGNLELRMNSTGAGGSLTLTGGTGLLSGTAGGASGQHLVLTINGVNYKIALLNP